MMMRICGLATLLLCFGLSAGASEYDCFLAKSGNSNAVWLAVNGWEAFPWGEPVDGFNPCEALAHAGAKTREIKDSIVVNYPTNYPPTVVAPRLDPLVAGDTIVAHDVQMYCGVGQALSNLFMMLKQEVSFSCGDIASCRTVMELRAETLQARQVVRLIHEITDLFDMRIDQAGKKVELGDCNMRVVHRSFRKKVFSRKTIITEHWWTSTPDGGVLR